MRRNPRSHRPPSRRPPAPARQGGGSRKISTCAGRVCGGGFRAVFGDADTSVLLRREGRGCKSPVRPPCSVPNRSVLPDDNFVLQLRTVRRAHAFPDIGNERQHVGRRSAACIHKKVRVALADARLAHVMPLQTKRINHEACRSSRRILENTSGTFLIERLARTALFVADANTF